jgi:hypothetical protein
VAAAKAPLPCCYLVPRLDRVRVGWGGCATGALDGGGPWQVAPSLPKLGLQWFHGERLWTRASLGSSGVSRGAPGLQDPVAHWHPVHELHKDPVRGRRHWSHLALRVHCDMGG